MNHHGPVRIGVVGLGYWGPNIARNVFAAQDASLAWVCDLRSSAVEAFASRYPGVRTTTSFETMLADAELDAVAVTTPVSTHHALARAALEAGKHVFVEKPMARSSAEAHDLIAAADERGRIGCPAARKMGWPEAVSS